MKPWKVADFWQDAGLARPGTGNLDRPVAQPRLLVPPVIRLEGDRLVWSPDGRRIKSVTPGPGLLERFVRLVDAADSEILQYARSWGVLEICIHDRPAGHDGRCERLRAVASESRLFWEPVAIWRTVARQARTVLDVAAELHDEDPLVNAEEQEILRTWHLPVDFRDELPVHIRRWMLTLVIDSWLRIGRVHPVLSWDEGDPSLELVTRGLYGALGIQLLMALAKVDGFALCSGCGSFYAPRRRPARGRRRYCEGCRSRGVPQRHAERDRLQRKREGKKPRRSGKGRRGSEPRS